MEKIDKEQVEELRAFVEKIMDEVRNLWDKVRDWWDKLPDELKEEFIKKMELKKK